MSIAIDSRHQIICPILDNLLTSKESRTNELLSNRVNQNEVVLLGGDALTLIYSIFQGLLTISPSLANIPLLSNAYTIVGKIGGGINIGSGLVSLNEAMKEAQRAMQTGNYEVAARLLSDFISSEALGTFMLVLAFSAKGSAIALFVTANPWVIPLFSSIAVAPVTVELVKKIANRWSNSDFAAQVSKNPKVLYQCFFENNIEKDLSKKLEILQTEIGPDAAIKLLTWAKLKLDPHSDPVEVYQKYVEKEKALEEWNQIQMVRLLELSIYHTTAAVGIAYSLEGYKALQATCYSMAVLQSLYTFAVDINYPLFRSTPIIVSGEVTNG